MAHYTIKIIFFGGEMELYIGLMSGTSADGIDAALVDFSQSAPRLVSCHYTPYSTELRDKVLSLCRPGENEIERLGELDVMLGEAFAQASLDLLNQESVLPAKIKAIGSHGQTIRHSPHSKHRFTIQIGDPNIIAAKTGITTIADFRRRDIACGGQGAPLVPAFHQHIFASKDTHRAIVNIGGIANVTLIPHAEANTILGFDTGPGNVLMDTWIMTHQQQRHDENGNWAALGKINDDLLCSMLADPYFDLAPPKSTGREYFNLDWINNHVHQHINPADVQATLAELTARSIIASIAQYFHEGEILICGGGANNAYLMQRLTAAAGDAFSVTSTKNYGVDPNWVEAIAFAWLARQTLKLQPGNLPSVTGASKSTVLGGVYY